MQTGRQTGSASFGGCMHQRPDRYIHVICGLCAVAREGEGASRVRARRVSPFANAAASIFVPPLIILYILRSSCHRRRRRYNRVAHNHHRRATSYSCGPRSPLSSLARRPTHSVLRPTTLVQVSSRQQPAQCTVHLRTVVRSSPLLRSLHRKSRLLPGRLKEPLSRRRQAGPWRTLADAIRDCASPLFSSVPYRGYIVHTTHSSSPHRTGSLPCLDGQPLFSRSSCTPSARSRARARPRPARSC